MSVSCQMQKQTCNIEKRVVLAALSQNSKKNHEQADSELYRILPKNGFLRVIHSLTMKQGMARLTGRCDGFCLTHQAVVVYGDVGLGEPHAQVHLVLRVTPTQLAAARG